jgi:glycosyltransferase involved in cell wall biosynthesis
MTYHLGLIMEQTLGHVAHSQRLEKFLSSDTSVKPTWMPVPSKADDFWQILPGYALRSSLRAQSLVRDALKKNNLDCLLYHTQTTGLFSIGLMQRIPTVISLDTTPINFNTIAATYEGYEATGKMLPWLKFEWYRRMFQSAGALVTWSHRDKQSLLQDYGVMPAHVTVIPPGVELGQWHPTVKEVARGGLLRLLFVGGDFARKGGHVLLEAFQSGLADYCTLDIVTKDENLPAERPVRVHRGLAPNSSLLRQLFAEADLFVFPTLGDASPIVVLEAMASGLPVITTNVGALMEQVEDGVTGLLVPINDPGAIVEAVRVLANNPARLTAMGKAGRARAERLFDAQQNYKALVEILKRCVEEQHSH